MDDVAACRAELLSITVVRGLLDAREVEVVRRLEELAQSQPSLIPQEVVSQATRSSLGAADRLRERAATAAEVPALGAGLSAGAITGDRVDVVARAAAGLSAAEKAALAGHGQRLAKAASTQAPAEFRRTVDDIVRKVRADGGLGRLARQRRARRLRWWLDGDGMWNLAGRYDPVTGLRLEGRLRNELERLRAAGVPAEAPTDPIDRQQYLAAEALAGLLCPSEAGAGDAQGVGVGVGGSAADDTGDRAANAGSEADDTVAGAASEKSSVSRTGPSSGGATSTGPSSGGAPSGGATSGGRAPGGAPSGGRAPGGAAPDWATSGGVSTPDVTVLIDVRTFLTGDSHEGTVCEAGIGRFGLPVETVRRWACLGSVTPVVVAADGVRLFLGRETRLANRAQRRALRVLYRTCALCDTAFDHCQVHHVAWFRSGGRTDIDNLLPLCNRHHHLVHEGGWVVHLAPDRTLTVTRPGGQVSTHGPPRAMAA